MCSKILEVVNHKLQLISGRLQSFSLSFQLGNDGFGQLRGPEGTKLPKKVCTHKKFKKGSKCPQELKPTPKSGQTVSDPRFNVFARVILDRVSGNLGGQRIHDLPGARSGLVFEVSLIEVNYIKEGGLSGCTNLFLVGFLLFSFQFPFLFIFKSFPFLLLFLCLLLLFFSLGQFLVSFLLSLLPLTFLSSFALLTLRLFLLFLCILLLKNKNVVCNGKKNITHHNISRFLWYPNPWNPNQNCFQTLHLRFYWNCFVLTSFAWIFSWVGWNRSLHHALPSWKKATCNPLLFHFPNPRQERRTRSLGSAKARWWIMGRTNIKQHGSKRNYFDRVL